MSTGTGSGAGPSGSTAVSGKGRPTPKRSAAQAARRTPLVGGDRTRVRARGERREAWSRTQEAYRTEDQRSLPARDRGPVRRYVRDVVDGRRTAGQYFLPAALFVLFLGVVPYPPLQLASALGMYLILVVVVIDSVLVFRKARAGARERFGDVAAAESGLGTYAVGRALQLRRMRRPVPQVTPGQPPR